MYDVLLREVIADWRQTSVLTDIVAVVIKVWTWNTQRHDPEAGDDALTLGLSSARNIANLVEEEFRHRRDVYADQQNLSLRVVHQDRTLRVYKLAGASILVDPHTADWNSSGTKQAGPMINAVGEQLSLTDYPEGAAAFARAVPDGPEHLHLAWAGDPHTGKVAIHPGFPRDNRERGSPWYAVECAYRDEAQEPLPAMPTATVEALRFDELDAPDVGVHLRGEQEEHFQ